MAMIVGRVIGPASKLGTVRALAQSTLAQEFGVVGADEDELYLAMDWLQKRQERIEDRLARRHLRDGEMVLYDVSSSYFEGPTVVRWRSWVTRAMVSAGYRRSSTGCCVTWQAGRSRSRCSAVACHDDKTLPSQVEKLKGRFGLSRVVVVADRRDGHAGEHRPDAPEQDGVDWITALKAPTIKKLARKQRGFSTVAVRRAEPRRRHRR